MHKYELHDDELHDVSSFEIVGDYTLRVRFDDESEQIINFEPILYGPLFGPLRELEVFNQVKLNSDLGTLVWPTGADIDPNVLYDWPHQFEAIVERRKKQFAAISQL
ncbi:MAG: DUF2442 domain-containing protein [Chloroflexi bacterium]|nr:DUF2442 domain-containing protein [Chloroflexota bacterium]